MKIKTLQSNSAAVRAALIAAGVFCVVAAFFVAKWSLANSASMRADTADIASVAADLGPDDPQTHYALAVLSEKAFAAEDLERAVAEFEKAAALSPHNYLLWLDLGRSRERSGDQAGAEAALRKALELAPNYSRVQWALGNTLIREGKNYEAFALIRKAVAGDDTYTNAAATTAWEILGHNIGQVREAIGDSGRANAALAALLAGQKQFDEAYETWNSLAAEEKKTTLKDAGQTLYRQFIQAGKFRYAARVGEQTGLGSKAGGITNGGFEDPVAAQDPNIFAWQIAEGAGPRIGPTNGQKRTGNYSLLMTFGQGAKAVRPVSQTVAVEPGKNYVFEYFYRSDVKTQARLHWEIAAAAATGKLIASAPPLTNAGEWTPGSISFAVPADVDGILVRFAAEGCEAAGGCSISGSLWFDDLSLKDAN